MSFSISWSKPMRGNVLCVASLAAAILTGGYALAQAPEEGTRAPDGRADDITGDDLPFASPPAPFSRFDLEKLWAVPGGKRTQRNFDQDSSGQDDPGQESRHPPGPDRNPAAKVGAPGREPSQNAKAARAGELKKALAPKPTPEAVRSQMLDALFERLRKASRPEDALRTAGSIERLWLQSHSDTANLLMQRAMVLAQAGQYPLALSLFDKLVALEPDWAEAWNQRATTRFLSGDTDGAMADIGRVVRLEPRHFGALAGMGMILQEAGFDKAALEIFNKVLGIYPLEPDIRKLTEKLTLEVQGQDI